MRRALVSLILVCAAAMGANAQRLLVGIEDASVKVRSSDLSGFPNVNWTDHWTFEVNGMACAPDQSIYVCNGPFSSKLYKGKLSVKPTFVTNIQVDIHGMGYGRGKLFGFSNFTSPMGIYEINTTNGACTLAIDTSPQGFRFFALDYNPADDHLYGYTEYGSPSGLYKINIDTGQMTWIVGSHPGYNGQGRGMAIGNNTVYLTNTRGDDGESVLAYDLTQGIGGTWTPFTPPFPAYHNTGGACWIPALEQTVQVDGWSVPIGIHVGGDWSSFWQDDDNYAVVGAMYHPSDPLAVINATVHIWGYANNPSYSSGKFAVIQKSNTTQAKYRIRADKAGGGFATLVDGVPTSFSEQLFENALPSPVSDFIDANNGNMLSCHLRAASGNRLAGFFKYSIDFAAWKMTP